eukprot:CAMPEP_0117419308 /NCGR_PEP_ID=MMETSP0758-20121206/905_1 /TAXON_ID=63605 /ORGANISM="Percolomonas cosmopolitus, Strain AE-1 (ATCC 50343)" /LENGTH=261 /DNA_ID=CAMNT_0005200313 /DNA_START=755 /DNA_END=1537 /DNA_ORIENTATION=+
MESEQVREAELSASQAGIDWQDFVVVETIDFTENDDLMFQQGMEDDEEMIKVEKNVKDIEQHDDDAMDMDMDIDDTPKPSNSRTRRAVPTASDIIYKDETTGKLVKEADRAEYMKVATLDPRWKQQKEKEMQKHKVSNLASNMDMRETIQQIAQHRPENIRKETELQENLAKQASENPKKVIWDGYSKSIDSIREKRAYLQKMAPQRPASPPPSQQQDESSLAYKAKEYQEAEEAARLAAERMMENQELIEVVPSYLQQSQ